METFLYYLPIFWVWFTIGGNTVSYILNKNQKDYLGLNEPAIWFYGYVIPIVIIFFTFVFFSYDFGQLRIVWTIAGIGLFIRLIVSLYIRRLRGIRANNLVDNFKLDLEIVLKEREKEEDEKKNSEK